VKRFLALVGPLPFLALAICTMGLAIGVAAAVFEALAPFAQAGSAWSRYALLGIVFAISYFAYGLSLLLIAPAINFLLGGRLQPYRGSAVTLAVCRVVCSRQSSSRRRRVGRCQDRYQQEGKKKHKTSIPGQDGTPV